MKAVVVSESETGLSLEAVDDHQLVPVEHGVSIDVEVAGVTYPDVLTIEGRYQHVRQYPFVPGVEAVGIVREAPPASGVETGQRVIALTPDGSWQEHISVPADSVFAVPEGISAAEASSMLVNYVAAHFGLVTRGQATSREILLVHGAAGGLGSAAIELGRALGMVTVAVVSSTAKAEYAQRHGADHVVMEHDWRASLVDLIGERNVDIVFDPVGGDRLIDSLRVLRPSGRYLVMGFTAGKIPEVKVNRLLLNNLSLIGVATGQFMQGHPGELSRQWAAVTRLLASGPRRPTKATVFDYSDVREAISAIAERQAVGRVAITFTADNTD